MGDVAKAFGVTLPAVTHIVDRLEQKAFLVRGDHPADRRIYMLDLTRAGKALVEELHAMRLRGMEGVLARMSVHDRRRVVIGLEALVDAASSESDGTAKPARGPGAIWPPVPGPRATGRAAAFRARSGRGPSLTQVPTQTRY